MTIDDMIRRKKELGYSNAKVAELSGVPLGTVQKVFSGATQTPRYDTLLALSKIFEGGDSSLTSYVYEPVAPYLTKSPGQYTLDDYYNLPDKLRVELIDGVIYNMTAPSSAHQLITSYVHAQFFNHVAANGGDCMPMISPLDVQLDCDDKTMIEPDLIVVCDRKKIIKRCIYGAPDFVLEVLSPSTKKKDMVIKLNKYMNAGVREFWMIDPETLKVIIYDFEHDKDPQILGFDQKVPVSVFDDKCVIDFNLLYEYISFLYD